MRTMFQVNKNKNTFQGRAEPWGIFPPCFKTNGAYAPLFECSNAVLKIICKMQDIYLIQIWFGECN